MSSCLKSAATVENRATHQDTKRAPHQDTMKATHQTHQGSARAIQQDSTRGVTHQDTTRTGMVADMGGGGVRLLRELVFVSTSPASYSPKASCAKRQKLGCLVRHCAALL